MPVPFPPLSRPRLLLSAPPPLLLLLQLCLILEHATAPLPALAHKELLKEADISRLTANQAEYEKWQGSKMAENPEWVFRVDKNVERRVLRYFSTLPLKGLNVLCVGARAGGEVSAFTHVGAFAVGIDIAPNPKSRYVLYGDATKLQFANATVDVVFTNVMDHIKDLRSFAAEVVRVLKPGGIFISEIVVQLRSQDEWAVRDLGTAAFHEEWKAALQATGKIGPLPCVGEPRNPAMQKFVWQTEPASCSGSLVVQMKQMSQLPARLPGADAAPKMKQKKHKEWQKFGTHFGARV